MMRFWLTVMQIVRLPLGLITHAIERFEDWRTRCEWCGARGGVLCQRCEMQERIRRANRQPRGEA